MYRYFINKLEACSQQELNILIAVLGIFLGLPFFWLWTWLTGLPYSSLVVIAIIIRALIGIWNLAEAPHRERWGETIEWAKQKGYILPARPTPFWWLLILLALALYILPGLILIYLRKRAGDRYAAEMRYLNRKMIDTGN